MRLIKPLIAALFSVGLFSAAWAADSDSSMNAAPINSDNSGQNKQDRSDTAVTPDQQSNATEDIDVTRAIRRAIVKDSALSVYAHNIKIITTKDHIVYLRGAITSSDNLNKIVSLAKANANGFPIKNQLSVSQ